MRTFGKAVIAGLALSVSMIGQASQVVTFEDVGVWTSGNFQSGGFNFSLNGLASTVYNGQYCGPACPVNGTNAVIAPYAPSSLTMSKGGAAFGLLGFDGAASFNFNDSNLNPYIPHNIDVVGNLVGGGTVSQSFAINRGPSSGPLPFTTFAFNSGFNNLSSVTFSASGSTQPLYNGFTVDNIAAVPEPETYAMMLAGLGLMGLFAKRKKQKVA